MLKKLILSGFGNEEDYNCAEKILYGANIAYGLNMEEKYGHLLSGYGGGLSIGHLCGAVAGAIAILGFMFVEKNAHSCELIKELNIEFTDRYKEEMGELLCTPLKEAHATPEEKCFYVILKAAEILDDIVENNEENIVVPYEINY